MLRELMGFAVMSLWILVPLVILVAGGIVVWVVVAKTNAARKKWAVGLSTALIVILIPTWDEILGRLYFDYLCSTKGGAKVYQQVQLPTEYWNADGTPKFIDSSGNKIPSKLDDDYRFIRSGSKTLQLLRIEKDVETIVSKRSEQPLGTYTLFFYFGGWLANATGLHVTGIQCPEERNYYASFLRRVFVPQSGIALGR